MADFEKAYGRLQALHPTARLWQHSEVKSGQLDGEQNEDSFIYVSFYEHLISNAFQELNGVKFILSNGFLSSHAYNLALCWVMGDGEELLVRRLKHNFKKFFAEASLNQNSTVITRALLLETLAYEQHLMSPVVGSGANTAPPQDLVDFASMLMTGLVQQHELGHYFIERDRDELSENIPLFLDGQVAAHMELLQSDLSPLELEEVLCDGIACQLSVVGTPDQAHQYDLQTRLRMCAFGFLTFSYLIDLQASADITAEKAPPDDTIVHLGSEKRSKYQHEFHIGRNPLNALRAKTVLRMLEGYADANGVELYGSDGTFPFPTETEDILQDVFETFMDETPDASPHQGTDGQGRAIMQLFAEALSAHPAGTEHLLWRSKTFRQGGDLIDP